MKLQSMMLRNSLLLLTSLLALPAFRAAAQSKPDSAPAAQAKPDAAQSQRKQSKPQSGLRSEEHTSELQSHLNLVCRLLLEKKKRAEHTYREYSMLLCPHQAIH